MSREDFEGIKELAKQNHANRVAKTPSRIEYAKAQFQKNNIEYKLKNSSIGHFHCWDKSGNLFQFWAGTGKIMCDSKVRDVRKLKTRFIDTRGISALIGILKG